MNATAEILALRHQLLVLQRQVARPRFTDTDRTILAVMSRAVDRARLTEVFLIVRPATVLGWHRRLLARHWTQPPATRTGRPPVDAQIRQLVIRLAGENPTWGYRRIHGEPARLGHRVAASTVWKILGGAGIDATPNRTGPGWADFIRSQADAVIATNFFCVDTVTLQRQYVLFFIESVPDGCTWPGSRPIRPARGPPQQARNLLMGLDTRIGS